MTVQTINVNTPFLLGVPNSRVSPEWIRFLGAIVGATNANGGVTSDDVTTLVFTTRKPVDQSQALADIQSQQIITALRGVVQDLKRRVEELEGQVQQQKRLPALLTADDISVNYRPMTSSAANRAAILEDNATNITVYPVWSTQKGGSGQLQVSGSQWTFNPATGKMTMTGALAALSGTAIPAGGTAGAGFLLSSVSNFGVFFGSGAPTLAAAQGSLYLRSDGTTTNNRAYINTNGGTTWTALTTAA